jgi:hypothetical protein
VIDEIPIIDSDSNTILSKKQRINAGLLQIKAIGQNDIYAE